MTISDAQVEAAARILAHRQEFNENHWPKYAEITRAMLESAAALAVPNSPPRCIACGTSDNPTDTCYAHNWLGHG